MSADTEGKAATKSRRYNLVLPESLFEEMQRVADEQGTTIVELMRRFIKVGLLAIKLQDVPGSGLIIRDETGEQKVMLF